MRIILPIRFRDDAWLGGQNYFLSLVSAIGKSGALSRHQVYVLTNRPDLLGDRKSDGPEIVHASWLEPRSSLPNMVNGAMDSYANINPRMYRFAKSVRADLITHSTPRLFSPCPTLFWMPDFQHRRYPQYFSAAEIRQRDTLVAATSRAGHILLSSHSAARDFRNYYPHLAHVTAHALQFTPLLDGNKGNAIDDAKIRAKYELPEIFFFLPNQFWQHKNHFVVLEALRQLPDSCHVVCTGSLADYRFREHISKIRDFIDRYSLQDKFRILGVVNRGEMLSLMRMSACVINPSYFEGWSTTVEEAKHMGKRLVLSDIDVHREQNPKDAVFFPPDDSGQLATAMQKVLAEYSHEAEVLRRTEAGQNYLRSIVQFGKNYFDIAEKVVASGKSRP